MFPAARKTDPITHDLLAPAGVIGPPASGPCPQGPVMIEFLPAAHALCTVVCTGATSAGPAHPPPPPTPPVPIPKGSPTVLIHGQQAARWSPAPDTGGCGVFLGDPKLAATRTVLIGDSGGGGGGGGGGSSGDGPASGPSTDSSEDSETEALAQALTQAAASGTALIPDPPNNGTVEDPTHTFRLQVVHDATGEPARGVQLRITLPDGREHNESTDEGGRILIDDLETPGTCSVTCPTRGTRLRGTYDFVGLGPSPLLPPSEEPSAFAPTSPQSRASSIAEIEEHKVQTGETLRSLAASARMSWQELARFNWGTDNPDRINEHLRYEVGCRHRTADGRNYRFDSSDDPGIVYVPRAWRQDGLATDTDHIIRVRALRYRPGKLRIRLFDRADQPMPGAPYQARLQGRTETGNADGAGWVEIEVEAGSVPDRCRLEWGEPSATGAFPFSRDVYLACQASNEADAIRRRLHNFGYPSDRPLEDNVRLFQVKYGLEPTGRVEDIRDRVQTEHDEVFTSCQRLFADLAQQQGASRSGPAEPGAPGEPRG